MAFIRPLLITLPKVRLFEREADKLCGKSPSLSMNYLSKFIAALVALLAMAIIASRQIFLFLSPAGGSFHLWLALGAGITAFIAGGLMFRSIRRYEKIKWSKVELTNAGPLLTALGGNPFINPLAPVPFNAERWALNNAWLSEGQANDRVQMDGSVKNSGETPSGQRAFARRAHQLMFKKWSQERHD